MNNSAVAAKYTPGCKQKGRGRIRKHLPSLPLVPAAGKLKEERGAHRSTRHFARISRRFAAKMTEGHFQPGKKQPVEEGSSGPVPCSMPTSRCRNPFGQGEAENTRTCPGARPALLLPGHTHRPRTPQTNMTRIFKWPHAAVTRKKH